MAETDTDFRRVEIAAVILVRLDIASGRVNMGLNCF